MPRPWTPADDAVTAGPVLVMGSRLELRSFRDVAGFLRAALAIRKQVRKSPGAIGVSLVAQPTRKTFWTLSAWRDRAALDAFVRARPHVDVMARYRPRMAGSGFEFWDVEAAELPRARSNAAALWAEARARLAADGTDPA
jgi:heme-degrading monooxygenase HmoA